MKNERGLALLVTLLVVALLTIVVIEFTYSTEVDAHLTRNALSATQARYLARSGVVFAELALRLDAEQKATNPEEFPPVETLRDAWALPFGPSPVADGFGATGYVITDESARFNVNALAPAGNPVVLEMRKQLFQGILAALGLDTNLLFPLLDWLDADDTTDRESGAESEHYLGLRPPYRPRNGSLLSLDELRLVRGFDELTQPQWNALRSLLTARGDRDLRINANTAPALLLAAIFGAFGDPSIAEAIVETREERPLLNLQELDQVPGMTALPPLVKQSFAVRSQFFTIRAFGAAGDARRGLAVTVDRPPGGNRLQILEWRPEIAAVNLTSANPSDAISGAAP